MKLRVWLPVPQISISCRPESFASITLRQMHKARLFSMKPMPPNIGTEVKHGGGATHSGLARLLVPQVQLEVFQVRETLVPFVERFEVQGTDSLVTLTQQVPHQVSSDKPAAAYYNQLIRIFIHIV
jgi:hypothetical protein